MPNYLRLCLTLCSAVISLGNTQLLSQRNELRVSSLPGLWSGSMRQSLSCSQNKCAWVPELSQIHACFSSSTSARSAAFDCFAASASSWSPATLQINRDRARAPLVSMTTDS